MSRVLIQPDSDAKNETQATKCSSNCFGKWFCGLCGSSRAKNQRNKNKYLCNVVEVPKQQINVLRSVSLILPNGQPITYTKVDIIYIYIYI